MSPGPGRIALGLLAASTLIPAAAAAPPLRTQVVLLGTGNPPADPERSGPATAVVVDDLDVY